MGAPEERALAEPPELGTRGGTERTKCKNIFDAAPVLKGRQCSEQPQTKGALSTAGKDVVVLPPCDDGWIWYQYKCYYFSEDEGDWTAAKDSCAALNSSLALIDTQKELDFMLRYKGFRYHWIGLQRESNQQWKWVNGTEFNNWQCPANRRQCVEQDKHNCKDFCRFVVADYSECAYLGHDRVKSVECYSKSKWICTQVSAYG